MSDATPQKRISAEMVKRRATDARSDREPPGAPAFDVAEIMSHAGETAYQWQIAPDTISWAPNADGLIEDCALDTVTSGGAFSLLVDGDDADRRFNAIAGSKKIDKGDGVGYCVQYKLRPRGRRQSDTVWVEEHGRWFADQNGRPALARGILRLIDDRHEHEQRLTFLSEHDELTGQLNRARLTAAIADLIERSRSRNDGAFLMAAVNNLSHVNETFGFATGDDVLSIVGRRLRNCLRGDDCIGRFGSNKFGLVLHDCGPEQLVHVAARLLRSVEGKVIETSSGALSATIGLGAVLVPKQANTVDQVIFRSLETLEWARAKGANGFAVYKLSEDRENRRRRNMTVADEVLNALNERRMVLALQPIVSAKTLKASYYEVLLRMRKPDGAIVPAVDFIPVAEQLGLARLVDHRVIELTAPLLAAYEDVTLAVNLSGDTTSDPNWFATLEAMTGGRRALTERLIIEITETVMISDITETARLVEKLKALGCKVAIDDFGAGYSSFRNLRLLDIDVVKLDGSFVKNLPTSPDDQIMVRALVDLAQNLGLETVAEWVGDEDTVKLLREMGVTFMQGYYFGTPKLIDAAPTRERKKNT